MNGTLGKLKAFFMQGFREIIPGEDEEYAKLTWYSYRRSQIKYWYKTQIWQESVTS
ncbi:MAG: hypothetical protein V7K69_25635 [Nostoc sp.]|uniref:hypothetical protein n=1 Tax=Nostoc sp. TaxID=1180 RepID=UPI002FFAE3C6